MPEPPPVVLLRPAELAAGVPYAYAATTRGRPLLVFTAGACPLDGSGSTVEVGQVDLQAEQTMANLLTALHAAGARLDDVVKATVYVASSDRSDLVIAWDVVRRHFGPTILLPPCSGRRPRLSRSAGRGGGGRRTRRMIRGIAHCESVTLDLHDVKTVGGDREPDLSFGDPVVGGEAA